MSYGVEISNYKVGFRYRKNLLSKLLKLYANIELGLLDDVTIKWYDALGVAVIRIDSFVYTVNYSGYVNLTGAKSRERVAIGIDIFSREIAPLEKPCGYNVHNISASGNFGHRLSLLALAKKASRFVPDCEATCKVKLRLDSYPAIWLQFRAKSECGEKLGTAGLFASGAFIIVGVKEESTISFIISQLEQILL
jgi:TATA-box binding protein (TBP) (component of TFIID and TFIIIB)